LLAELVLPQGEEVSYVLTVVRVTPEHPLVVSLAYTDAPAPLSASGVLTNDLDLRVEVIPLNASAAQVEQSRDPAVLDQIPRLHNFSTTWWGNAIEGGDPHSNHEQFRLERFGPCEVVVTVRAKRIGNSSFLPGGDPRMQGCQSFALVAVGHLATDPMFQHPLVPTPNPLPQDICGRQRTEVEVAEESGLMQLLIIIIASVVSCLALTLLAYLLYFLRRRRQAEAAQSGSDAKPRTQHPWAHARSRFLENHHQESQYLTSVAFDRSLSICVPLAPTPLSHHSLPLRSCTPASPSRYRSVGRPLDLSFYCRYQHSSDRTKPGRCTRARAVSIWCVRRARITSCLTCRPATLTPPIKA
jgi:hypothetical protein